MPEGQHARTLTTEVTTTVNIRYLLFLPQNYERGEERWPLILFLHGAGERGNDLDDLKRHGPPKVVEARPDFPFIVVSPQCPQREFWSPVQLIALLDEVMANYRADPERVYLTGLSMGGFGTWATAMKYPDRFAALAPICGGGDATAVAALKHLPVWVFHGAQDKVVPVGESQKMVDALKAAGADVQFTIYPEAGHDSWTETYDNPALYEWFLQHRRERA